MKTEPNSLSDPNNYNPVLDATLDIIMNKYSLIIVEYLNFVNQNVKLKNRVHSIFFIIRGLEMLTTIFNYILFYTKNIDITYIYCQKSIYFYAEFISQINDTENFFLQLSSRDAVIYVYNKTIFEISIKNIEKTQEEHEKYEMINEYIQLYKTLFLKIININQYTINNNTQIIFVELNKYLELHEQTINNITLEFDDIKLLSKLVDTFYYNIDNIEQFYELINRAISVPNGVRKMLDNIDFN